MKLADLNTGAGQLRDAFENLRQAWSDTREHWNDDNRRRFEDDHLQPLSSALSLVFPAIEQLAQVVHQAGRECGPWDGT
jgi:hypothetical protein